MGLFGKIVATAINVAALPVAATKDVFTLGTAKYTSKKLQQIKDEAE